LEQKLSVAAEFAVILANFNGARSFRNGKTAKEQASSDVHRRSEAKGTAQFGLIAEDVADVNPDLVARDENGEICIVRYDAVTAMLLNEFLKEHRKVEEQGAIIAKQQKQIEALTAGLQKMSDPLEMSKPAPQTILNNQ
jgi:hypothetical protein